MKDKIKIEFAGRQGVGKTVLMERLIPLIESMGYKVTTFDPSRPRERHKEHTIFVEHDRGLS